MWQLDHKENWVPKNWCFCTVVLEKTLESNFDCKEIQPVHPKANQSWIFIGRTDAKVEALILWPPDVKYWLIGKDPDAGKDWRHEKKGMTEEEMVGWHHQLNGRVFEQVLGVGDGQGGLACCGPRDHKESDMTERLNWTEQPHLESIRCFCLSSCSYSAASSVSHPVCGCAHGICSLWSTWPWVCLPMSLIYSCSSIPGLVKVQLGDLELFLRTSLR